MSSLRLDERIPERGFKSPDDMLFAFLDWVSDQGLTLYKHQEEAILEVFAGRHVVLDSPTGSGKSLVATALHFKTFCEGHNTWYTAPIKALVAEKFFGLCRIFGAENVGMATGDGTVNRNAPIVCCTAEILANLALREGKDARVGSAVLDEFHYYADRDRGWAWQVPLLSLPQATFLLMSATLGDTTPIREDLEKRTGRSVADVKGAFRPVPLEHSYSMTPLHEVVPELVQKGRAPIYVVHFTQADATEHAQALLSTDLCTREEKRALAEAVKDFRFHSPFGMTVRRFVLHGVGVHHAGLLPRYRLLMEKLAQKGLLKVICGTDTLGVGINVPIRTVLFTQLCKFDGEKTRILEVREFKQISGRAGRAGFDTRGYVVAQAPAHVIENARIDALADEKKRKRTVRAQPPQKGYKPWDEAMFRRIVESQPEPLQSRFLVDHGRLLTLMQRAEELWGDAFTGVDALHRLVDTCHATANEKVKLHLQVDTLYDDLVAAKVVFKDGYRMVLDPGLQKDFSLHHSLSLFLLDAIEALPAPLDEKGEAAVAHGLDILTRVEAILENPRPVLIRQADREKGRIVNELKAAGVPYEDRIAALEDVTWPRPQADAIYEHFNTYATTHPWVGAEAIRPKAVAREMAEVSAGFGDYVRDLGIQRSEGVLLRYLTEVYKALVENVPATRQTDAFVDLVAYFRAMLAVVDSSLLTEWEQILAGGEARTEEKPVDISADRRTFAARVRAELHAVVRALSRRDWEEAAGCLRRRSDDSWDASTLEVALKPFLAEHGELAFDHRSRLATCTTIQATGPHQWTVRQRLLAPLQGAWGDNREMVSRLQDASELEEESAWALLGRIDLRDNTNPDGPLVEWVGVEG